MPRVAKMNDDGWDFVGDLFEARKQRNTLQEAVDRLLRACDEADMVDGLLSTNIIRLHLQGVQVEDVKLPEGGDEDDAVGT